MARPLVTGFFSIAAVRSSVRGSSVRGSSVRGSSVRGSSVWGSSVLVGLAVFVGACGPSVSDLQVRYQASMDLECDESALVLTPDGAQQTRAEGCGRTALYTRSCPGSNARHGAQAGQCSVTPVSIED